MANGGDATEIPRPSGLVLAPFRALRYDPERVALGAVLAPPYDVIDEGLRSELAARDPHNVVRLTLPREADEPERSSAAQSNAGQDGAQVLRATTYDLAAATLRRWRSDAVLRPDPAPALYVYEEQTADHVQRGLVGALGLTPAEDGIVLPHENTMAGPVADRLALMTAVEADLEPIFLVYDGGGAASRVVAEADAAPPLLEVETSDGITHRLWAVTDPAVLDEVAADLARRRAVIADGHHRYATFLSYQAAQHAAGRGPGPWDLGLALLVDGSAFGPLVHAIHRVIPGLRASEAAERARGSWSVREVAGTVDDALAALAKAGVDGPAFVATDGAQHWLLSEPDQGELTRALPSERSQAWRSLDVTIAHLLLIRRTWGLDDREGVVDYAHDVGSAVAAASAAGGTALLLNPTPVAGVAAVAAAGDRMPRKSTLFVPKPATGLLIRAFADAAR
jgi:uncharacterized protein (DUF1015 family)